MKQTEKWFSSAEVRRVLGMASGRLSYLARLMRHENGSPRKVGGALVWTEGDVARLRSLDESTPRKPRANSD